MCVCVTSVLNEPLDLFGEIGETEGGGEKEESSERNFYNCE